MEKRSGALPRAVQKFYETLAKKREWDMRGQMRALEAKIGLTDDRPERRPSCPLFAPQWTGEVYDSAGLVSACEYAVGQQLSLKVLALFDQMNAFRKKRGYSADRENSHGTV